MMSMASPMHFEQCLQGHPDAQNCAIVGYREDKIDRLRLRQVEVTL
jgi:hypothetical protein